MLFPLFLPLLVCIVRFNIDNVPMCIERHFFVTTTFSFSTASVAIEGTGAALSLGKYIVHHPCIHSPLDKTNSKSICETINMNKFQWLDNDITCI